MKALLKHDTSEPVSGLGPGCLSCLGGLEYYSQLRPDIHSQPCPPGSLTVTSGPGCRDLRRRSLEGSSQVPLSHEGDLQNLESEALRPNRPLSPFVTLGVTFPRLRSWGSLCPEAEVPRGRGPCAAGRLPGRCGKGWAAAPSPRGDSSRPLPLPPPSLGRRRCSAQETAARGPDHPSRSGAGVGAPGVCVRLRAPAQQPEQRPPPAWRGCPDAGPRGWAPGGNRSGGAAPPLVPPRRSQSRSCCARALPGTF